MIFAKGSSRSWFLCLSLVLFSQFGFAQVDEDGQEPDVEASGPALINPDAAASQYYTFDETQTNLAAWSSPQELLQDTLSLIEKSDVLSLVRWILHDSAPPAPDEPYKRTRHFGGWRRDEDPSTCYNTRARVLMRDSQKSVTFSEKNHCVVESGLWKDPYTGDLIESARQIQIDHVVPLKHAYISGASKWTPAARCTYANFEANPSHLLSVSGHENMKKGDRSPADYMPPDENYLCDYLQNWLTIKMTWRMFMTQDEVAAITATMKEHHCSNAAMKVDAFDLRHWRQAMQEFEPCANFTGESRKKALITQ